MDRRSFLKLILVAPVALAIPKVATDLLPPHPEVVVDFVPVQPLSGPVSQIFFLDIRYRRVGDRRLLISSMES